MKVYVLEKSQPGDYDDYRSRLAGIYSSLKAAKAAKGPITRGTTRWVREPGRWGLRKRSTDYRGLEVEGETYNITVRTLDSKPTQ